MGANDVFEFYFFAGWWVRNSLGGVGFAFWDVGFQTVGLAEAVQAVRAYVGHVIVGSPSGYESGEG